MADQAAPAGEPAAKLGMRGTPLAPGLRAALGMPKDLLWQRFVYRMRSAFFGTPIYAVTLPRRGVGSVAETGPDPWPGNAQRGAAILQVEFPFAGQSIRTPAPLWMPVGASTAWQEEMHGFDWLRDLRAVGGDAGRRAARELVGRWMDDNTRWSALAWRPDIIGRRLASWIGQHDFYGATADAPFRSRLLVSGGQQARHLARVLPAGISGGALLVAIKGLILAGLALPRGQSWLTRGRVLLERELPRQILADGGHVERSPAAHMAMLRHLIDLRAAFNARGQRLPAGLQAAIDGMTPILRLFQHGDGGLALFNDSNEDEGWRVDMVLTRANGKAKPLLQAPQTGFQRLVANRTLVIVDSGAPPAPGFDRHAHAGTLSFEMSVGRERMIVNCGAHPGHSDWRMAQRMTAAHSTAVIDDTNSSVLRPESGLARRPDNVVCRREETEGNIWLDISHDGYLAPFGRLHRRRLYLAAGGEELRGEDRFSGAGGKRFAVRFHLHPQVQVSLSQNAQAAILRLPSGVGWRLRTAGTEVSLEESVYLGRAGEIRRSQQVVIAGPLAPGEAIVKWALAREAKKK